MDDLITIDDGNEKNSKMRPTHHDASRSSVSEPNRSSRGASNNPMFSSLTSVQSLQKDTSDTYVIQQRKDPKLLPSMYTSKSISSRSLAAAQKEGIFNRGQFIDKISGLKIELPKVGRSERKEFGWETKKVMKWDPFDVSEWLETIGFSGFFGEDFSRFNTGRALYKLDFSDEIFLKVESEKILFVFFVYLHYLKYCVRCNQHFKFSFHFVLTKMLKIGDVERDWGYKELAVMCSLLSDRKSVKKHFLDCKELSSTMQTQKDLQNHHQPNQSQNSRYDNLIQVPTHQDRKRNQAIKIKLIITETTFSRKKQLLRRIVSPFISKIKFLTQDFGLFHSALLVGPYYLEWTTSELIIPKQIKSGSAYLTIDINPITVTCRNDLETVKAILGTVIEKWNTTWKYASLPNEKKRKGNCQTFIYDVCKALNIKLNFGEDNHALRHFVRSLNERGECKLVFEPSHEFVEDFQLLANAEFVKKYWDHQRKRFVIEFHTHKELDDLAFYFHQKDIERILYKYSGEYSLLKSFDRAFWLRHLKDPENELFRPAERVRGKRSFGTMEKFFTGCPFLDPRDTMSFQT